MSVRWRRGSFTVEASILMPFLILIVFVMVCLGLFWHDRSVLASCAAELAGKGAARKYETDAPLESWLTTEAAGLVEGRLYLLSVTDRGAKISWGKITVTYTGYSPLLGGLKTREQESASRHNPVSTLRKSRQIKELAE